MNKILYTLALALLLGACQGNTNADAAADASQDASTPGPTAAEMTKEKLTNFSGEIDARYLNAMVQADVLVVNFLSTEGDTIPVSMAFDAASRTIAIPDNFMVPLPGQEGAFMPNPDMGNAPYVIEYKFGKPTVLRIK